MEKKLKCLKGNEAKGELTEIDLDLNANKSHEEPEPEISATELAYSVTVDNSFNNVANLEDEDGKKVIHDIPKKYPVDEEEKAICEKLRISVKKKVEMKLQGLDASDDFARELEEELIGSREACSF